MSTRSLSRATGALFLLTANCLAAPQATLRTVVGSDAFGQLAAFVGDLDGDGFPESVARGRVQGSYDQTYRISGRTGDVTILTNAVVTVLGDLDGDGKIEVSYSSGGATVEVRAYCGGPVRFTLPSGTLSRHRAIGDTNADGVKDIVRSAPNAILEVYSGASGSLLQAIGVPSLVYWPLIQCDVGDINFDGHADYLVATQYPYAQSASSTYPAAVCVRSGQNAQVTLTTWGYSELVDAVTIGDVDADALLDVAVISSSSGDLSLLSGATGTPIFTLPTLQADALAAAGDVDLDGIPDLAVRTRILSGPNPVGSRVQVRSGADGTLLFSGASTTDLYLDAGHDVNRDGYPDVLIGEPSFTIAQSAVGRVLFLSGSPTPPLTYCQGKSNSLGCVPYIWASGSTSLSGPNNLVVHAADVLNNKLGIMFWGRQPNSAPFLGGTLCISTPFVRADSQNSGGSTVGDDCSGRFSYAFSHSEMAGHALGVGSSVYCQFWYRDPGFPPPANVGLTNGAVFTISF